MPWVSASDVEPRVGKLIADNNWEVGKYDQKILESSVEHAKNEVIRIVRTRGYTISQINSWSQQSFNHSELSTYFSLVRMGFKKNKDQDWIDEFDIREKLEEDELFDKSGALIEPGDTGEGVFEMIDLEAANASLNQEP